MKMYELLFSLRSDQWIIFQTDKERGSKYGKRHGPMKVGNITIDMIGARHDFWRDDVYNIRTFQKDGKDILYFNIGDVQSTVDIFNMYEVGSKLIKQTKGEF